MKTKIEGYECIDYNAFFPFISVVKNHHEYTISKISNQISDQIWSVHLISKSIKKETIAEIDKKISKNKNLFTTSGASK